MLQLLVIAIALVTPLFSMNKRPPKRHKTISLELGTYEGAEKLIQDFEEYFDATYTLEEEGEYDGERDQINERDVCSTD